MHCLINSTQYSRVFFLGNDTAIAIQPVCIDLSICDCGNNRTAGFIDMAAVGKTTEAKKRPEFYESLFYQATIEMTELEVAYSG